MKGVREKDRAPESKERQEVWEDSKNKLVGRSHKDDYFEIQIRKCVTTTLRENSERIGTTHEDTKQWAVGFDYQWVEFCRIKPVRHLIIHVLFFFPTF